MISIYITGNDRLTVSTWHFNPKFKEFFANVVDGGGIDFIDGNFIGEDFF